MLRLLRSKPLLALAGYALWRRYQNRQESRRTRAAYANPEEAGPEGNFSTVRNAGPEAMRDRPDEWDRVDEQSDESFPASDPPGRY